MTPSAVARLLAVGLTVVYTIALYFGQDTASKLIASMPTVAVALTLVFDKWAWKWWGIASLVGRPRLEGVWSVTLRPDAQSHIPDGGNRGPIVAYMVIEQTLFVIHVTQYTAESVSHSTTCRLGRRGDSQERRTLSFVYRNEPKQQHQGRSPSHAGACELYVSGLAPIEMEGRYWTTRFTAGDMKLAFLDRKTDHASFGALEQEYGSTT